MSLPPRGQHVRFLFLSLSILIPFVAPLGCLQNTETPSVQRSVTVLVALLEDKNPEVRRTSAESLGKIGDRSAAAAVLPLLSDPVSAVRAAAAQALGRMAVLDDEAVISGLARSLEDPDDQVRDEAALAIGELEPSPRQLQRVVDLLQAADVKHRRAAVRAFLSLDTGQVVDWLLPLLNDPDAEVRQGSVAAIGLSGDARAVAALRTRLAKDPSPAVRAEAAYHLGELSGQDTRTLLGAAFEKETDPGVRRWIEAELKGLRAND
jgi:HEAT repeat protein